MNWITDFVKPKLRALIRKKDIPDNLWIKCDKCGHMIFHRVYLESFSICNHCDHHMKFPITGYFDMIFTEYELVDLPLTPQDPLKFKDLKKYTDRLKQYRNQTKRYDAALVASGQINKHKMVAFGLDFDFLGGSMGTFVGNSFVIAVQKAIELKVPLCAITASGGARMQEAVMSLMQMPKTVAALELLKDHKLPYFVLLTNPTFGGVTASFAMLGDVQIAEPGALIGFAGPRVIEQTIRQKLPEGFQTAEYLLEHGMIDKIVHRKNLQKTFESLLKIFSIAAQ